MKTLLTVARAVAIVAVIAVLAWSKANRVTVVLNCLAGAAFGKTHNLPDLLGRYLHQAGRLRVIDVLRDRPVLYALDHFVHNKKRNEEPLTRFDLVAEAILDFNIQLRVIEHAMNYVL
jgi:hypothetical protein